MRELILLRRIALAAFMLCFAVVVLGAYVRLSAAGLGCPDWPGCYGHLTPTGAVASGAAESGRYAGTEISVGKAWKEMIHRYAAATLGLLIVVIAAMTIQYRRIRGVSTTFGVGLLVLVVAQGVLGMLTVTWQLKPMIVTGHLLLGFATLSALGWLALGLYRPRRDSVPGSGASALAALALLVVVAQVVLGGWTSTNYAATACPDFPACQGAWWPQADFAEGFVPWRGLGINYEGGVLPQLARVAIQLAHRLGAVVTTLLLLYVSYRILAARRTSDRLREAGWAILAALALQLVIGSLMVLRGFPLWLATAHNAGAALLLLSVILLNHAARHP
jgi:cytochrome c oxidase assembly protein subunit 15